MLRITSYVVFLFLSNCTAYKENQVSGHAILPYDTTLSLPKESPGEFQLSGKYVGPLNKKVTKINSIEMFSFMSDKNYPRTTGISLPQKTQPLQGFSGLGQDSAGNIYFTSDNGYGTKKNSLDAPLYFGKVKFHDHHSKIEITDITFLKDPNKVLKFPILLENSKERYLTGRDLDPESIQVIGDKVFFGDEYGPYIVEAHKSGVILAVYPLVVDGFEYTSPSNPKENPGKKNSFKIKSSRGFEGLALSKNKKTLFAALEAPMESDSGVLEGGKKPFVRVFQFDLATRRFLGNYFKYFIGEPQNSVGAFQMLNENTGLIIERDWGEGDQRLACKNIITASCFNKPAKFKKLFKAYKDNKNMRFTKMESIDLVNMDVEDEMVGKIGKTFSFPFVTIEGLTVIDDKIIIVNDNNYGFSSGRKIGINDSTEFVTLKAKKFLNN